MLCSPDSAAHASSPQKNGWINGTKNKFATPVDAVSADNLINQNSKFLERLYWDKRNN